MEGFSHKALPPEILTQIFEWIYLIAVATSQTQARLSDGKGVRQLCWPVSQVSKYWREVALAAPFLWTYLPTINLDDDESPSPSQQLERLKALIPRTRNHPLHISVVSSLGMDFDESLKVVDYITGYSERWGTLSLKINTDFLEEYFEDIRGRLPRLEMLKLDFLDGEGEELTLFVETPNLKFVYITGDPAGFFYLDTRALVHIYDDTSVVMHNLQPSHEFPALTSLEVFDMGDTFDYSHLSEDEDVFVFPALKTLDYCSTDDFSEGGFGFLRFAETPALEELTVVTHEGGVVECLLILASRSGYLPLKYFHLRSTMWDMHEETFPSLLELSPELETLNTNIPLVSNISSLAISQGPDILVPRLREWTMRLNWTEMPQGDHHRAIATMANARCSRPQPPNSIVDSHEDPADDVHNTDVFMQLCVQQDLSLEHPPRTTAGLGHRQYAHSKIYPIKLEFWYDPESMGRELCDTDSDDGEGANPRRRSSRIRSRNKDTATTKSLFAKLVSEIVGLVSPTGQIKSTRYKSTIKLITQLDKCYKPQRLVDLLAENTSPALIYLAYVLKNEHTDNIGQKDDENSPYNQVLRILSKVKADLLQRLAEFHWIWEISSDTYNLRYIHDGHEIRADPDKFANAILGLSNDPWIQEDL